MTPSPLPVRRPRTEVEETAARTDAPSAAATDLGNLVAWLSADER